MMAFKTLKAIVFKNQNDFHFKFLFVGSIFYLVLLITGHI